MDMETRVATSDTAARGNHLVDFLPTRDRTRLLPELELVELPVGRVLFETGCPMPYGYFTTTAIVSCLHLLEDGKCAEVAVVGNEGFIKILQRIPGQGIRVVSKNKDYESWTINENMDFEVLGRVLKVWKSEDF